MESVVLPKRHPDCRRGTSVYGMKRRVGHLEHTRMRDNRSDMHWRFGNRHVSASGWRELRSVMLIMLVCIPWQQRMCLQARLITGANSTDASRGLKDEP
jgi:hypothetical protein